MSDYLRGMYADPAFREMPVNSRFERLKLAQAQGNDIGEDGAAVMDLMRRRLLREQGGNDETAALNDAIDSNLAVAPREQQMGFLESLYDFASAGPVRRAMSGAREAHQQNTKRMGY